MACKFASRVSVVFTGLLFLVMALSAPASAQDCVPADITLTSQSDVDNFQSNHGPCDRVATDLSIIGADIFNLDGLSAITSVGGDLLINGNAALTNMNGLSAITSVGRYLWIMDNAALPDVNGLSALSDVDGARISDNVALTNVNGLSALSDVDGLYIWNNNALTNVDGLSALTSEDALYLDIRDNDALSNIDGLSSLTNVGRLDIWNNDALTNVDGLSALTNVITLSITNNNALTSIDGLSALTSVSAALYLNHNKALTNVNGLSGLATVDGLLIHDNDTLTNLDALSALREAQSITVVNNPSLDDCLGIVMLVDPIDDYEPGPRLGSPAPDIADTARIENNLDGCNSIFEILAEAPLFEMNAGLNDAWFNSETNGQGFFIIVFPEIKLVFMAWFTYDTERPPEDVAAFLGEPGHRWLTAQGEYEENVATLDAYITVGGVFDSPEPEAVAEPYGEIMLEFSTCNEGTVTYDIPSVDRQGVIPIERIVLDNVPLCYVLNSEAAEEATKQ